MEAVRSLMQSRRANRVVFWLGALVLVAGAIVFIIKISDSGSSNNVAPAPQARQSPNPGANVRYNTNAKLKDVDPAARTVARHFIMTAVARRHVDQSWKLSAPALRQGYTKKSWASGNIDVVPYIGLGKIDETSWAVEWTSKREVQMMVSLQPNASSHERPLAFHIGLIKVGNGAHQHWLVDYWMPVNTVGIPYAPGSD